MTHSVSEKLSAQIIALYASAIVATDFQEDERRISKKYLSLLEQKKIHTTKYIRSCRWTHTQSRKLKMYGDNGQLRLRTGAGVALNVHGYPTPECY